MPSVLEVGCGLQKPPGAIGIDANPKSCADVIHNLDDLPWPFDAGSFDRVNAMNVLEHLADTCAVMHEIHRVCRPGAIVTIVVPHFSSSDAYTDVTHRRAFGLRSFDRFCGGGAEFAYDEALFRVKTRRLNWWHLEQLGGLVPAWVTGVPLIAARHPGLYERFLAWSVPAQSIYLELIAVKEGMPSDAGGESA